MISRAELYGNADTRVYGLNLHQGDSPLLVCFSPWSERPSLDAEGFAEGFCKKYNYSALFIVPAKNDWYQSDGSWAAVKFASNVSRKCRKVIAYGSSMGGFGALNYASQLSATVAIAVIPQFSIDGSRVGFEKRWRQEASQIRFVRDHVGASSTKGCDAFAIFDPFFEPDRLHAELIEQSGAARLVRLPFIGHSGPGGVVLRDALSAAISGGDVEATLRNRYRSTKKTTAYYYLQMARLPKKLASADRLRLLRKAAELAPRDGKIDVATAQELMSDGDWQAALEYISEAVSRRPSLSLLWSYLASVHGRLKRYQEALEAADKALHLVPTNPYYLHQKAGLLNQVGRHEDALSVQEEAVRLAPGIAVYSEQLDRIKRLGCQ